MDIVVRCLLLGDPGVGKTCLLTTFVSDKPPKEHKGKVFNDCTTQVTIDRQIFTLSINAASGKMSDERQRRCLCAKSDVFLICFPVTQPKLYEGIRTKWYPELKTRNPDVPIILVGTKTDLRRESVSGDISREQGLKLAKKIGAWKYVECSAFLNVGLKAVFNEAVKAYTKPRVNVKDKSYICNVL